jgi:hypothetical protein
MMIVSKSNKLCNLKKLKLRETNRERERERERRRDCSSQNVEKGNEVEFKEIFNISRGSLGLFLSILPE